MIETAVIPAAGYGTRMRPLTIAIPKEMFPVRRLPLIEYTINELVASGIKRISIVIREGKEIIKEYLNWRKKFYNKVELFFVYQERPLGLGDAIRKARDFIKGMPFVMAIPDQILISEIPATKQLLAFEKTDGIWSSMVEIPECEINFFRGARPFTYKSIGEGFFIIEDISSDKTSLIRGFGRTLFLPEALEYMTEEYINEETGEIDLLKTFQALKSRYPLYGIILKGKPCDLGTWEGYYYYQRVIVKDLKKY